LDHGDDDRGSSPAAAEGRAMMNGYGAAAMTPDRFHATAVELQHSVRQAQRTADSLWLAAGALLRDGSLALLGLGDAAVQLVRDLPRWTQRLLVSVDDGLRAMPDLGDGLERLCERGQEVLAQLRTDDVVQAAVRRTGAAQQETRQAAHSVRRAVRSQAAGVRHSAAALGRDERSRYRHMTAADLRSLASRRHLDGYSHMTKRQLIAALSR
jgi:hypothetical protein